MVASVRAPLVALISQAKPTRQTLASKGRDRKALPYLLLTRLQAPKGGEQAESMLLQALLLENGTINMQKYYIVCHTPETDPTL